MLLSSVETLAIQNE
jgi:quinol monooxygenase YgiN